ncbi:MAG: hypothetical protein WD154_05545 [Nitrosopumilaceae archaeon]
MLLKTDVKTEVDNKDWDNLLLKIPSSTAFQMSSNYDPYKMAFDSKPLYVLVEDSSGRILGQLLAIQHFQNLTRDPDSILQSLTSKFKIGSTINWHYGPIIHDDERAKEITANILEALNKYSHENKVLLIKGSSTIISDNEQQNQYLKYGYENTRWDTWVTDLKPELDITYNSLHNKTRYDIRKGEKSGLTFDVINDRSILDEWMKIKYFGNKHKKELIKKYEKFNDYTWEILYKHNYEKMYIARLDGDLISGIANKLFNKNVVQHAVINSHTKLQGGSFLTWYTIKWSKENNFITYDMGGANPSPISEKEKGIRHFKSKWNGKKYDFIIATKIFDKNKLKLSRAISSPGLIKSKFKKLIK